MFLEPEDRAVNIDIDLAAIGKSDSLEDNIVSIYLVEQLTRATVASEAALNIVKDRHDADTLELAEKIEKVLDDIQDVYNDVLAEMVSAAEKIVDSSYFVDSDTEKRYTYRFARKKSHPVLILTEVAE